MPQRKCCISTCTSSLIEGVVLHSFPNPTTDYAKFHTWIINAGLEGEDDNYVFKNRRICKLHFKQIYYYPKNRLNRLAVPTLNVPGGSQDVTDEVPIVVSDFQPNTSTIGFTKRHIKVVEEERISGQKSTEKEKRKTPKSKPEKCSTERPIKRKVYVRPKSNKKAKSISQVSPLDQKKDESGVGRKDPMRVANVGRQNKKKREQTLLRNIKVLKLKHAMEKKKMLSLIKKYQYRCRVLTRKIKIMNQKNSHKEEH